jgi:hypothetical protein
VCLAQVVVSRCSSIASTVVASAGRVQDEDHLQHLENMRLTNALYDETSGSAEFSEIRKGGLTTAQT